MAVSCWPGTTTSKVVSGAHLTYWFSSSRYQSAVRMAKMVWVEA